jgi:hypothetical protein
LDIYTPTITSQGGSITTYTATGKYLKIDKGMFFIFTVTLSNVGTATGNMIITLPFTAVGSSAGSAYEYNTTGKGGPVSIANNASVAIHATLLIQLGLVMVGIYTRLYSMRWHNDTVYFRSCK